MVPGLRHHLRFDADGILIYNNGMKKGTLAVISGFSGVGKGTLVKALLEKYDNYALSISATTRKPRVGEVDGREYFFISKEEFESGIRDGKFLEYNNFAGNYYGTPKKYVEEQLNTGKNIILEIDVHGGFNVKKSYPETRLIFVTAPNMDIVYERLVQRGTETKEQIMARIEIGRQEAESMKLYDYVLVNDSLDEAVKELNDYINKEA